MATPGAARAACGVVVIGRNEGARLRVCLHSVLRQAQRIVYVDSGSTDGSPALARSLGVTVVELDAGRPFTAARARNAGLARLSELTPEIKYVQFVDGDCELADRWLEQGLAEIAARPEAAAVFGRLRERHPERSLYNRLCDREWEGPLGPVRSCGGVTLMRVAALRAAGGFNPSMIAGEEPELCLRLRQAGGTIVRIGAEMALHDVDIRRFGQWWKRSVRGGFAYAEGLWRHGAGPLRWRRRKVAQILFWTLGVPAATAVLAALLGAGGLTVLILYPGVGVRACARHIRTGAPARESAAYAGLTILEKFAQLAGMGRFGWSKLTGTRTGLIEHKLPSVAAPNAGRR